MRGHWLLIMLGILIAKPHCEPCMWQSRCLALGTITERYIPPLIEFTVDLIFGILHHVLPLHTFWYSQCSGLHCHPQKHLRTHRGHGMALKEGKQIIGKMKALFAIQPSFINGRPHLQNCRPTLYTAQSALTMLNI